MRATTNCLIKHDRNKYSVDARAAGRALPFWSRQTPAIAVDDAPINSVIYPIYGTNRNFVEDSHINESYKEETKGKRQKRQ
jgi:hypothetical protein